MSTAVTVRPCATRRERRIFAELPERLHGEHPCFVPPLPGTVDALLRGRHLFRRHGRFAPFLAWRGPEPVGRIAAIVNETHNAYHGDTAGFFGFFDAVDDGEVARALFASAETALAAEGRTSMRGPYSPTANDECGVLVHGFDTPPVVGTPFNPPYYARLVEAARLRPVRELLAFRLTPEMTSLEYAIPLMERALRSGRVRMRYGDPSELEREMRIFHDLFNRTLAAEWGFMPLTLEDVRESFRAFRPFLDPKLAVFLEEGGEPVAFCLGVPDLNEAMLRAKRSRGWARTLRFLWHAKARRPKRARLPIFGGTPSSSRRVLDGALFARIFAQVRGRYEEIEFNWIQDVNHGMLNRARAAGLQHCRTYRIFEKEIGDGRR